MLRHILGRERALPILAVVFVVGLTWVYTLMGIGMPMSALEMTALGSAPAADPMAAMVWTPATALFVLMMWWMMIAMMPPSAAPTVLLYAAVNDKHRGDAAGLGDGSRDGLGDGSGPGTDILSGLFLLGYLAVWALMGLLFVGGVMNVYWIAGIAFYVLVEKTMLSYRWLSPAAGVALIVLGGWRIAEGAGAV